jgi:hypothetical protein
LAPNEAQAIASSIAADIAVGTPWYAAQAKNMPKPPHAALSACMAIRNS